MLCSLGDASLCIAHLISTPLILLLLAPNSTRARARSLSRARAHTHKVLSLRLAQKGPWAALEIFWDHLEASVSFANLD